ncbi:MAG: VOC family protein [Pararhodobacter sp.]|nr:VOC family protein [Pararhodobacter sp.]
MNVAGLHHVAYRCRDAARTAEFYERYLGLVCTIAIAENRVPSTGEWSPHIHIFFEMGDGSFVAFFELPESPEMSHDPATPAWVQHLALRVPDMAALNSVRDRLIADGHEVVGPTDHTICQSLYFFDPDGHRLEVAVDTMTPEVAAMLREKAPAVLSEWSQTKRAPEVDPLHERARG